MIKTLRTPFFIALTVASLVALAGCGNKGPLVMPQKPVPVEVQPVTPPAPQQSQPQSQPPQSSTQDTQKTHDQQP